MLGGVEVYHEAHGVLGQPNAYRRLVVTCPLHCGDKKAACRKTRAFGVRARDASGLGDLEPYAFLGAWLAAGDSCGDAAAHKRHAPTPTQVREYVDSQGWRA